jgi:hypothetical protein
MARLALSAAGLAVALAAIAFVSLCLGLLVQELSRGVSAVFTDVADRLLAWRHAAAATGDPEATPVVASGSPSLEVGPYRAPGFLIEPEPDPSSAEDRATSLGLCSAAALLAGVFTLSIDGPRTLAAVAFLLGALLAGFARRSF